MRSDAIAVIAIRISYRVESIEKSYNKNFQRWLYVQSHEKEILSKNQYGWEGLVFDENGFITNATFSKKTISGFDLLEQDFIKKELKRINAVKTQSLDLDDQKYIEFVKAYFENKEPENKPLELKPKEHKALYHVISYILECYANNKQLPTGKGWERAGEERKRYFKSGNTFYKQWTDTLCKMTLTSKSVLIDLIGEDWREILLVLSDDPQTLEPYLDTIT